MQGGKAMAENKLIFKDAEKARNAIVESQKKEIAKLYEDWSKEIMHKASKYKLNKNPSDAIKQVQLKELRKMLKQTSKVITNEVENKIKQSVFDIADSVVSDNTAWLKKLGLDFSDLDVAFSNVPDSMIRKLITGQIYDSGWSLSKKIWNDNEQTLKELYSIVAGGIAMNESIYDISKKLEKYVSPSAARQWNLVDKDGRRIYPKKVDYNAQRLARTLSQHAYQQSFIETTKDNPFIVDYVWNSNGSRACPICQSRDGKHYKKDELPMDHPNGMCTMVPNVEKNLEKKIIDWANSLDGTYPEIDEFAKKLGYIPEKPTLEMLINKYGNYSGKNYSHWLWKLPDGIKAHVEEYKKASGLSWQEFYELNFKASSTIQNKALAVKMKDEIFSGIWKDDVKLSDYINKKDSIQAKYAYYNENIILADLHGDSKKVEKLMKLKQNLQEYEEKGKEYLKLHPELSNVKAEVKAKIANNYDKTSIKSTFKTDLYTEASKANTKSFTSRKSADKYYRPYLDSIWDNYSEYEKYSVWEYTQNSNPINKPLSGYHDDWDRSDFLGLGKTNLGHEDKWRSFSTKTFKTKFGVSGHKDYKAVVKNLTKAVDRSVMQDSVFSVRGTDYSGFAGLLEGDLFSYSDAMKLLRYKDVAGIKKALEGQIFTNHAFTSTGISKGSGLTGSVTYEIFMPKGTKALYAEPASYYGDTIHGEEIYKVGKKYTSVGQEAELLIQRGTTFRITSVEKNARNEFHVKMEVVSQPNYFKTGLEHTHNGGKTSYKK